jgi:hypothetical protein
MRTRAEHLVTLELGPRSDHAIDADDVMQGLEVTSKLNAHWGFLMYAPNRPRSRR